MHIEEASPERPVAVVRPARAGTSITQVSRTLLEEVLSNPGGAVFRDFSVDTAGFEQVSGCLSDRFMRYVFGTRRMVSKEAKIQTVNLEFYGVPMHSELADSPLQPHVCWFYCVTAPRTGGETLLSDSAWIPKKLPAAVLEKYADRELLYEMPLVPDQWRAMFDVETLGDLEMRIEALGMGGHFRLDGDKLIQEYRTPLFTRSRFSEQLCCVNAMVHDSMRPRWHYELRRWVRRLRIPRRWVPLLAPFGWVGSAELTYPVFEDGTPVPASFIRSLARIANAHQYVHRWRPGDVLLIDNTRFLHGRRRLHGYDRRVLTRFGHVARAAA